MSRLTDWWHSRRRVRERARFSDADWTHAWESLPLLAGLNSAESSRLGDLARRFLHDKTLEPVQGLRLTDRMRLTIAFQACLPVLELGLDWYQGWYAVILYPDAFLSTHEVMGEDGVVGVEQEARSGESWEHGPVILSWPDIRASNRLDGDNVILHELAHKLDGCSGRTNGCPPLHAGMSGAAWKRVFAGAFDDLCRRVDQGEDTPIDPYATESPAEFFAVVSEAFFEVPALLVGEYPDVYAQLSAFYRQDPLRRQNRRSRPAREAR